MKESEQASTGASTQPKPFWRIAGATVLAAFFGSDAISFTTVSEDVPGVSRSYASFSEASAEAGMSRICGGIHFMSANTQGLASGARLGQFVVEHFLKKTGALQTASVPGEPFDFDTPETASADSVKQLASSKGMD